MKIRKYLHQFTGQHNLSFKFVLPFQLSGGCELTVVIHDFLASNGGSSGELTVRRGQTVEVLERLHDKPDWCLVRTTDRSPAQEGIVPCSMLCIAHSRSSMEMEGLFNHKGRRIFSSSSITQCQVYWKSLLTLRHILTENIMECLLEVLFIRNSSGDLDNLLTSLNSCLSHPGTRGRLKHRMRFLFANIELDLQNLPFLLNSCLGKHLHAFIDVAMQLWKACLKHSFFSFNYLEIISP